jgi:hypothetical protein
MAKSWKAFNNWKYSKSGVKNLAKALKNSKVSVYLDDVPPVDSESYENYSFHEESKKTMGFQTDFLKLMKDTSTAVMRIQSSKIGDFFQNTAIG